MGKHDLQFRKSFKDPELFRQACEIYLPDAIKSKLKLETLRLRQLSGSFIRHLIIMEYGIDPDKDPKTFEQLKVEIADIVYTCECIDRGQAILIGHFEHQSKPDKHYAIRNALYDISALKDYVDSEKPEKYPLIVSLMIYHGKVTPYPYETDVIKMFQHPELAEQYFLKPLLVDYGQYSDQSLLQHGQISGFEIAFKHAFDDEVSDKTIENLMQGLKKCTKIELIRDWYLYALKTWESPAKTMLSKYKEYLTEDEEFIMTAAEQLKQQGMQQGMQQGALEKAQETARNFLNMGISVDQVVKGTGLEKSVVDTIKKDMS